MTGKFDNETLADQPLSTLGVPPNGGSADDRSPIDRVTGTTAEERTAFFADAKETIGDALGAAIDKVKGNPKTAAAIAAGATAAVAGAAYGASKLAKSGGAKRVPAAERAPAKKAPAKR